MNNVLEQSPVRSLSWRCDRALELLDHRPIPLRPTENDDHLVEYYYWFLYHLRRADEDEELCEAIAEEFPHMIVAHQLYYSETDMTRALLEARLLTPQPEEDIARNLGVHRLVVQLFEALFFAVRDKLHSDDYIRKAALTPPFAQRNNRSTGSTQRRKYLYRVIGYYGGVEALNAVLHGNLGKPTTDAELEKWMSDDLRQALILRGLEEMLDPGFSPGDVKSLIRQAIRLDPRATEDQQAADAEMQADADKIIAELDRCMHGSPAAPSPMPGRPEQNGAESRVGESTAASPSDQPGDSP
jgi:hypothetical protein